MHFFFRTIVEHVEDVAGSVQDRAVATENAAADLSTDDITALKERIRQLECTVSKLATENEQIQNSAKILRKELTSLKKFSHREVEAKVTSILAEYFTPGQIRCILNKDKKIQWSQEDIAAAISLKSAGSKAYRYLRYKLKYPLPHISTLRKWATSFDCGPGILHSVLSLMKAQAKSLTDIQKVTVISFDEAKISSQICFDIKNEQVLGPVDNVQVIMARGLLSDWKQPVYYQFDKAMTIQTLTEVVTRIEECGFRVVAQVSDLGAENRALWKKLNITTHNTSYPNPVDPERNIYVFADVPHLLKLSRNHLLDKRFSLKNGERASKGFLQQLLDVCGEINLSPKFTQKHLDGTGPQRQKVKTAAQLFSNSVANALTYACKIGKLTRDVLPTARTVKLFND